VGLKHGNQYEQLQLDLNIGQDFTLEEYADFIHPEDAYVTVATKVNEEWIEKSYKTSEWLRNVRISPNTNSYNSVNTFYIPKRSNANVRHLNAFFVDLDTYNEGINKTEALEQIDFLIDTNRIPTPTFIIDSGRGLYAIWKINSVPGKFKNVQKLYSYIQNYLVEMMSGIGADPQATDMARVLRTPGSFNTKNNSVVQVLRSEDIVYAMRYLQEFMNDNIGYNQKEIDKRNKENRKNKQKSTKTQRKLSYLFNFYTLAIARANDIRKLCELRNYKVVGFRNTIIHIYAYQILLIEKNKHVSHAKVTELNEQFSESLPDKSISEIMQTVYKAYKDHLKDGNKGYNYRNDTIINKLNITSKEQKEMQTLITLTEKRARDYASRRKKRRNNNGLTPKQQEIKTRRKEVKVMKEQGFKQFEIAKQLDVTIDTIKRDYKAIRRI